MNNLFEDYKHNNNFTDLVNYKIGHKIYRLLLNKNHSNLIIQGVAKSGKTLLTMTILNDILNIKEYTNKSLYKTIYYEKSHIHYYFDLKKINNDINLFYLLKEIVSKFNHYTNNYHYIILDNFEYLSETIQNKFKVLFEKCSNTTKIIIITSKYNNIIDPLKSRFINIRVPAHKLYDKFIYFRDLLIKHLFVIDDDNLINILKKHDDIDYNFINILGYIKTNKIYGDIYDEIINKYMIIIKSDKNICKKICDIKQLLYLAKSVINVNIFLRRLLSHLLNLNYNNEQKIHIIKEFTEYDIMINKSFRDLLCLEGLLIGVMGY